METFTPLLVMLLKHNEPRHDQWSHIAHISGIRASTDIKPGSTASDCGITIYKLTRWQQLISEKNIDYCDHVPHHYSRHKYMFQTFQKKTLIASRSYSILQSPKTQYISFQLSHTSHVDT